MSHCLGSVFAAAVVFFLYIYFGFSTNCNGVFLLFLYEQQGPVASASGVSASPSGGAPPPPPPGPPPPAADLEKAGSGDAGSANRNALFASLNKGSDVTKGKICQRSFTTVCSDFL